MQVRKEGTEMVGENEKGRGQEKNVSTRGSKTFFGFFCLLAQAVLGP